VLSLGLALLLLAGPLQAASLNDRAPDFKLPTFQETSRSLSQYRGKVVLINFWASWCAPCQIELPELDRLAAAYPASRFRVVAINVDEHRKTARETLARLKLAHIDLLWDARSRIVNAYDIETMPTSFIVDPGGTIRAIHQGFHPTDPQRWRNEVNALLKRQVRDRR
jgi:peroxiredoxin